MTRKAGEAGEAGAGGSQQERWRDRSSAGRALFPDHPAAPFSSYNPSTNPPTNTNPIHQLYQHNTLPSRSFCTFMQTSNQGGRAWQPFVRGKNGHENFRQARIYNFRDKCVVFARNRKKSTQWNMQYILCNSALLAQETLFLTQKGTFCPKISKKCVNRDKS